MRDENITEIDKRIAMWQISAITLGVANIFIWAKAFGVF